VRACEDVHVAAESDHDLPGPFLANSGPGQRTAPRSSHPPMGQHQNIRSCRRAGVRPRR
jgi:hypothetical protein